MIPVYPVRLFDLVRAGRNLWWQDRGNLLSAVWAAVAVTAAGLIGGGPWLLVAALLSVQALTVGRLVYRHARSDVDLAAFNDYVSTMTFDTIDEADL